MRFCTRRLANLACLLIENAVAVTSDPMGTAQNP